MLLPVEIGAANIGTYVVGEPILAEDLSFIGVAAG
jgi:hypothetical protein